jgi:hypothetical protein
MAEGMKEEKEAGKEEKRGSEDLGEGEGETKKERC